MENMGDQHDLEKLTCTRKPWTQTPAQASGLWDDFGLVVLRLTAHKTKDASHNFII